MPIHDWTRVDAGLFHAFHQSWITTLAQALNSGVFMEGDFELPADKPLTLVSYEAAPEPIAYIEPVAVGDVLPEMPVFLSPEIYVPAPLEATYQAAWSVFPAPLKWLLETPKSKGNGR